MNLSSIYQYLSTVHNTRIHKNYLVLFEPIFSFFPSSFGLLYVRCVYHSVPFLSHNIESTRIQLYVEKGISM